MSGTREEIKDKRRRRNLKVSNQGPGPSLANPPTNPGSIPLTWSELQEENLEYQPNLRRAPRYQIPERQESAQPTDPNADPIPGQRPTQRTDPSERGREAESGGYTRTIFTGKAGSAKVPVKPVGGEDQRKVKAGPAKMSRKTE
jgi:hypothetical protein